MAKAKNVKNRNVTETDFTFNEPKNVVIRFNSAAVLSINLDMDNMSLSGKLTDEVTGAVYDVTGTITEGE